MVSKLITLLFVLPVIYAKIEIDISARHDTERDVRISGSHVDPVSETEMKTFHLNDENLKKSVEVYFGQAPDSVYLNNPTPWGGLYKTFNWEPVRRSFAPKRAAILAVEKKPELIYTKDLSNTGTEEKTYNEHIHQNLEAIVSSKWKNEGELSVDDIHYHLDMKKPEDSMYFGFTAKYGKDTVKSTPVIVDADVAITLKPGQNAKAQVFATKETMRIRVDYETSLAGSVAINYDKKYKGHRFWAMDVNTVLEAGGSKKEDHSSETIEVVHYTEATILVKDVDTNEVLYSAQLDMQ